MERFVIAKLDRNGRIRFDKTVIHTLFTDLPGVIFGARNCARYETRTRVDQYEMAMKRVRHRRSSVSNFFKFPTLWPIVVPVTDVWNGKRRPVFIPRRFPSRPYNIFPTPPIARFTNWRTASADTLGRNEVVLLNVRRRNGRRIFRATATPKRVTGACRTTRRSP